MTELDELKRLLALAESAKVELRGTPMHVVLQQQKERQIQRAEDQALNILPRLIACAEAGKELCESLCRHLDDPVCDGDIFFGDDEHALLNKMRSALASLSNPARRGE